MRIDYHLSNMKKTQHQQAIHDLLKSTCGPMSADEIRDSLRNSKIGIATIYRALNKGVEEGEFKEIEFPNSASRYERCGLSHHHHFICDDCDKAYDLSGCVDALRSLLPKHFTLKRHEIFLYGQCGQCKAVKKE